MRSVVHLISRRQDAPCRILSLVDCGRNAYLVSIQSIRPFRLEGFDRARRLHET